MSTYSQLCSDLKAAKKAYQDMQIKQKNLSDLGMSIDALDAAMQAQMEKIKALSEKLKAIDSAMPRNNSIGFYC